MSQDILVLVEHLRGQVTDTTYTLLAQARQAAAGGKVIALLLGSGVEALSRDLAADEVLYCEHPALADFNAEATQRVLAVVLNAQAPRLALLGETTMGADVAGGLSIELGLPLVSCCRTIQADGGTLTFTSQVCGGKLVAEGEIPAGTTLMTMQPGSLRVELGKSETPPPVVRIPVPDLGGLRVCLKNFVEPQGGDVDIAREPLLIGIGRGIQRQDNLEVAQDLADALGGVVCATRPVVDQNWLPTSRLVGKSGKSIKPQVYLALGISGAPEHCEAITASQTIIAVNTDPAAPIFGLARYGTTLDLLDLAPVLAEKARAARGA